MPDNLDIAFRTYMVTLRVRLQERSERTQVRKGPLRLITNKAAELQAVTNELESGTEFSQLVAETRSRFSGDNHGKSKGAWHTAVQNFFRRSGYYIDTFEGTCLNDDATFYNYCQAFRRREIRIGYLVPMEYAYFAETSMDFGAFQVRRFSADELETILQNRVNEIFYPWAAIDVRQLKDYWFVHLTDATPAPRLGLIPINRSEIYQVSVHYTPYPKGIESALQVLALYDWQASWWKETSVQGHEQQEGDSERGWLGFHIPFVLCVDDNLLASPNGAPDLSKLETEPFVDPRTGEEIGEQPVTYCHLNKAETESFKVVIRRNGNLLANLRARQNDLQFMEIAQGFFIKAFFDDGLEQMLWHITLVQISFGS